ncbi:(Fe-S)-binding protein [Cryptosporangium aurantiacum]|uniref:Fe-S oxidoreductase n=1 Tax=Cryptosporangium aurantiacum TaxID=134849 RepID=A0A1M7RD36_9ACTN|nr:(Fe-S)-binding protein [Cryptosporangium aurantiacum]SHN44100.1 Fe-S oxidoreductase [Cryptosporangium aurantiacum]
MDAVQIVATVIALGVAVVGLTLFIRAIATIVRTIKLGAPDYSRTNDKGERTKTMLREFVGHTKMMKWHTVGIAHWFVAFGFILLVATLANAIGQLFAPHWVLPIIGHFWPYELLTEFLSVATVVAIAVLIVIRQRAHPRNPQRKSRFAGSNFWQAYFVEFVILAVPVCILLIRGFEAALTGKADSWSIHFAFSYPLGAAFSGLSEEALETAIVLTAAVKVIVSFVWMIVLGLNPTMGVAWHRFSAFFNIFFKRNADGAVALGALKPMTSEGKPLDFEEADPEKDVFGVSQVEHFSWKGMLDFTTCTECGRCQSQCPAWNTGKPLSPKLLITGLRDHAYAKAPYLAAGGGKTVEGEEKGSEEQLAGVSAVALAEAERPLIGDAESLGVIDPDVLWSCTTCGACVEQCPVDIEHVDHIVDMRRYQVMIESSFPSEAGVMLRNIENKGNPWGANPNDREEWTKNLGFEVRKVEQGEPLPEDVEYLFWVGCAGALEDRAKKVTKAVATLLHEAGVEFAILGTGETCTGDPARRIGNEFVFQMQAMQNVEVLNAAFEERQPGSRKIVATCAHCFNTLKNEYPTIGEDGGNYEVVHHTELLSTLVRDGKLTPVTPLEQNITFHDPCYLGRHNRVFSAPREVLGAVVDASPNSTLTEMPRFKERSFCCGAGGARMWMEERIGKRINVERTEEALSTGAEVVAIGCPFCLTMLSDGVTGAKASGTASDSVEVLDVSQVLLKSIQPAAAEAKPSATPVGNPVSAEEIGPNEPATS